MKLTTTYGTEVKDCGALYRHSTMHLHGVVTKLRVTSTFAFVCKHRTDGVLIGLVCSYLQLGRLEIDFSEVFCILFCKITNQKNNYN